MDFTLAASLTASRVRVGLLYWSGLCREGGSGAEELDGCGEFEAFPGAVGGPGCGSGGMGEGEAGSVAEGEAECPGDADQFGGVVCLFGVEGHDPWKEGIRGGCDLLVRCFQEDDSDDDFGEVDGADGNVCFGMVE